MIKPEAKTQQATTPWLLPLILSLTILFSLTSCATELQSGDILYLATDAHNHHQIFRLTPTRRNPTSQPVTQLDREVLDFAINAQQEIVLTAADSDPSSDIWFLGPNIEEPVKIINCIRFECRNPRWSPKLALFIYEKRPIIDGEVDQERPTLWWYDLPTQQSVQVFADDNWIGQDVRFSADGQAISYVVPLIDEVQIFNITTGEVNGISSRTRTPVEWGPDDTIYFSALLMRGGKSTTHILRSDTANSKLLDISGPNAAVDDSGYSISPSGEQLAFIRKPARASTGGQIWVMKPDGSDSRSLTDQLSIQHGAVSWSQDSQKLVYQKFDLNAGPAGSPTIWMLDVATGKETSLAKGTRPQWAP